MSRIIRAEVISNSKDEANHRVKIKAEGYFTSIELDSINGIYLRAGDVVFVWIDDSMSQPVILGRCTGQLELTELVNVLNKIIDILNEDKSAYESHSHQVTNTLRTFFQSSVGSAAIMGGLGLTDFAAAIAAGNLAMAADNGYPDKRFANKMDNIDEDTLLKPQ